MKVLIIHWGQSGGGPRFAVHLIAALADLREDDLFVSYNERCDIASTFRALKLPEFPVSTYRNSLGVLVGLPRLLATSLKLRRYIREHEIEVVFSPFESLWQSLSAWIYVPRRVRYIPSIHDAEFHPGERLATVWRLIRAIDLARADRIVVYSDDAAKLLRNGGVRKPISVSVHAAYPTKPSEPRRIRPGVVPVIGLFGRLQPYKGVQTFVAVARRFESDGVAAEFRIVGDGPEELIPADLPANLIVDRRWIPDEAVVGEVAAFDLLVLPYTQATQSGVLALAMALGIPAVVTPIGGLREQVETTSSGIVARDVSPGAVFDAIHGLMSDAHSYGELSANGVRASQGSYSWARVAADVAHAFRST